MSDSNHVLDSFPAPVMVSGTVIWDNPVRGASDWYVPWMLDEELDHRCHLDASVVKSSLFSVLEYFEQYYTWVDARGFRQMQTDENEVQMWDSVHMHPDTAIAKWTKHWNHRPLVLLLAVLILATRRICGSYAVEKKWITNADR